MLFLYKMLFKSLANILVFIERANLVYFFKCVPLKLVRWFKNAQNALEISFTVALITDRSNFGKKCNTSSLSWNPQISWGFGVCVLGGGVKSSLKFFTNILLYDIRQQNISFQLLYEEKSALIRKKFVKFLQT